MALVEIAGHRIEIDRIPGSAPTLVFLHEGLGCVSRWRDFPRAVASATGRSAIIYSRRGYGRSEPRERPWPLTFMHDEARRVLPALLARECVDDAVLIGHSDGASIALIYTGEIGRAVRGLVTLAPHVIVEDVCVQSIAALRDQYEGPSTEVRQKLAKHHADVDGAFYGWADTWLDPEFKKWDLNAILPGVKVPTLVIQGEDDEYGTLAQVDLITRGVSGPSERMVLPHCGHVPQKDQPEETLAAVVRFVRSL